MILWPSLAIATVAIALRKPAANARCAAGTKRRSINSARRAAGVAPFSSIWAKLARRFRAAGASYHPWTTNSLLGGGVLPPDEVLVRLVTSFATRAEHVEEFLDQIRRA